MIRKLLAFPLLLMLIYPTGIAFALPAASLASSPPLLEFSEIATGLSSPVAITNAGDSSGRLFITLLGGEIMIYDGTQILPTPFLNISSLVLSGGEQGLLSVAFHPSYESNGYFFVYYTRKPDAAIVVARYKVSANPNVADASSASIIITIPHSEASNHNGGQLQFGPYGYLYIGTGDGGTGGVHSQQGNSLLGKILRLDIDGASPYTIPPTNPFVSDATVADEVWALGLRNPWRFSFDRLTQDLIIADVGQDTWEEVNVQDNTSGGGQNYGWPCNEGMHPYNNIGCTHGTITPPVVEYNHGVSDSNGCAVTGGYMYRGTSYPGLYGVYLYGDLCSGRIWGAAPNGSGWTAVELASTGFNITTFGEAESGDLYVSDYYSGTIYKILASGFSDVAPSYWAWPSIETLYGSGITGGCTSTPLNFCPESGVTRAQISVFLLKGLHGSAFIPPAVGASSGFGDVPTNYWAAAWIKQLAAEGMTSGCGDGNYCPDSTVTRAQMSIFLLKAKNGSSFTPPAVGGSTGFGDVPITYWAAAFIKQLVADAITSGCGNGNYCPEDTVTRAQMAVFLVKTFNLP